MSKNSEPLADRFERWKCAGEALERAQLAEKKLEESKLQVRQITGLANMKEDKYVIERSNQMGGQLVLRRAELYILRSLLDEMIKNS